MRLGELFKEVEVDEVAGLNKSGVLEDVETLLSSSMLVFSTSFPSSSPKDASATSKNIEKFILSV